MTNGEEERREVRREEEGRVAQLGGGRQKKGRLSDVSVILPLYTVRVGREGIEEGTHAVTHAPQTNTIMSASSDAGGVEMAAANKYAVVGNDAAAGAAAGDTVGALGAPSSFPGKHPIRPKMSGTTNNRQATRVNLTNLRDLVQGADGVMDAEEQKLMKVLEEMDADHDGTVSLLEIANMGKVLQEEKRKESRLKKIIAGMSVIMVVLLVAMLSMSLAANELAKESHVSDKGAEIKKSAEPIAVAAPESGRRRLGSVAAARTSGGRGTWHGLPPAALNKLVESDKHPSRKRYMQIKREREGKQPRRRRAMEQQHPARKLGHDQDLGTAGQYAQAGVEEGVTNAPYLGVDSAAADAAPAPSNVLQANDFMPTAAPGFSPVDVDLDGKDDIDVGILCLNREVEPTNGRTTTTCGKCFKAFVDEYGGCSWNDAYGIPTLFDSHPHCQVCFECVGDLLQAVEGTTAPANEDQNRLVASTDLSDGYFGESTFNRVFQMFAPHCFPSALTTVFPSFYS